MTRRGRVDYIDPISTRTRSQNNINVERGKFFSIGLNMFAPVRKRRTTSYSTSSGEGVARESRRLERLQNEGETINQEPEEEGVSNGEGGGYEDVWEREDDQPPLQDSEFEEDQQPLEGSVFEEEQRLLDTKGLSLLEGSITEGPRPLEGSDSECSSDSDSDSSSSDTSSSQEEKQESDSCASSNKNETIELKPYCSDVEEFDTGTESDDDKQLLEEDDTSPLPITIECDPVSHAPVPTSGSDPTHSVHASPTPVSDRSHDSIGIRSLPFPSSSPSSPSVSLATPPLVVPSISSSPTNTAMNTPPNMGPAPAYNQTLSYIPRFYQSPSPRPNSNLPFPYMGSPLATVAGSTTPTPATLFQSPYPASVAMLQYMQYIQHQQLLRGAVTPSSNITRPFSHIMNSPHYQQQQQPFPPPQFSTPFLTQPRYHWPQQQADQSNETTNDVTMTTDTPSNSGEQSHVHVPTTT